jgi:N6-adenosine-specific RNA methylase IME4
MANIILPEDESPVNLIHIPARGEPVSMGDVVRIERWLAANVLQIDSVEVLAELRARTRALEQYLRDKEMQGPALGAQRLTEARIGQLLPPEVGGRGNTHAHAQDFSDYRIRHEFRLLSRCMDDPLTGVMADCPLSSEEWRKSRRALVSLVRNRLGLVPELEPLPTGIFRCVVADPPWVMDTGPDGFGVVSSGHDHLSYEQMSVEQISQMPVAESAAEDAHLYLWTTNKYIESAYSVARAWGFKPSVLLVWCKTPRGVGLGDAYRITTEFCLYARRGNLKETRISETTWFNWPRGRHSKKPDEFFELVESMTPANGPEDRLELFSREKRDGWTVWGDEV